MFVRIYVIRHGFSTANNRDNIGTMAFGAKNASLEDEGIDQAERGAEKLHNEYAIKPKVIPVAVSQLLRTRETAQVMGFRQIKPYALLNEVEHEMNGRALRILLDGGGLPNAAIHAAKSLIDNPPSEKVWVTHGLIIAGLSRILGADQSFERLIPRFCEIRTFYL
jgi:hypothetical protein